MSENLIVEKRNSVAIVTLNRPEVRNAFDDVLIADLTRVFLAIEKDEAVSVLVLAGAGSASCARRGAGAAAQAVGPPFQADRCAWPRPCLCRAPRAGRALRHRDRFARRGVL